MSENCTLVCRIYREKQKCISCVFFCYWPAAALQLQLYPLNIPTNRSYLYFKFIPYKNTKLVDVDKDATINLKDETLTFKGKSENKEYELDIVFFKPVDSEGSTYKVLPRSVVMHVMKKEKDDEEFWPRLLKDKALEKNRVSTQYSFCMFSYCNVV